MSEENETLGSYLRRERKKRDVSLEQVSYATRISLKMLTALEEDAHSSLPAEPFVRGYLQAYAKYVKLDPKDVLLRYQHHLAVSPAPVFEEAKESKVFAQEKAKDHRRLIFTVISFTLILAGSGAYLWVKGKIDEDRAKQIRRAPILQNASIKKDSEEAATKEATTASNSGAEAEKAAEAAAAAEAEKAKQEAAAEAQRQKEQAAAVEPPTPEVVTTASDENATSSEDDDLAEVIDPVGKNLKYNLQLKAKENVWIRFQTDANEIKDLILRKDRTIIIRANSVIRLFSGNLQGLDAEFNGKALEKMTGEGRKRSVVLPFSEIPKVPLPLFPENVGASQESSTNASQDQRSPASNSTETL